VEKSANCISTIGRSPDGHAHHGILADGGVKDASGEFARQIFGGLEGAAKRPDVLAVNENARIVAQGHGLGFADRFKIGDAHVR
jgi:hypothetical protein